MEVFQNKTRVSFEFPAHHHDYGWMTGSDLQSLVINTAGFFFNFKTRNIVIFGRKHWFFSGASNNEVSILTKNNYSETRNVAMFLYNCVAPPVIIRTVSLGFFWMQCIHHVKITPVYVHQVLLRFFRFNRITKAGIPS